MPKVPRRMRAATTALISGLLLVGLVGPAATEALDPPNLERFMAALGAVESHGRYDALNSTSGALGKYQILPANWRSWARRYLGDPDAAPTPANQDEVTRRKLAVLYEWLGDWGSVAHWWLTGDGDTDPNHWSDFSRDYVNRILAAMGGPLVPAGGGTPTIAGPATPATPVAPVADVPARIFDDASPAIRYSDGWGQAQFARYDGGVVRYAVDAGATAWFSFSGTSVSWVGPIGPTRGEANIYIDAELVATVDVYASHYRPRAEIFSKTFDRTGVHTLTVEVVGTPGREVIAIDEFVVGA